MSLLNSDLKGLAGTTAESGYGKAGTGAEAKGVRELRVAVLWWGSCRKIQEQRRVSK